MSASKDKDDLTVCPICFERFKIPKCLPCLHTFCKTCLENFVTSSLEKQKAKVDSSENSGFSCPICRTFIQISSTDKKEIDKVVENLPTNHLIVTLIDREDIKNKKKLCSSCQRQGTEQIATSWCCQCTDSLCDTCVKWHKSFKALLDHKIVPLDQVDKVSNDFSYSEDMCEEHANKKLEGFCHDHKQRCCITCITLKHRKCDHITTLEEAAGQVRAKPITSELANSLQTLNQEFKDEIANCEINRENWESQTTETKRKVKALKEAAIKYIEDLEERIQQEINLQEKICGTDLSEREEILKDRHTIVTQCSRSLDLSVKHANNVQLFLEINKIEPKITELKEFLAKAKSDTKSYQMTFEADSTLKSLMQTGQFGKLSLSTEHLHKKRPDFKTAVPKLEHVIQRSGARFRHFVFVGDEHILVCDDRNNDVCLYTLTGKMETRLKLPGQPWGICVLSQSQTVITIRSPNSALFIDIDVTSKSLTQGQTIQMDEIPRGVTYSGECIIVSLPRKLHFMKTDGTLIRTISTNAQYICDVQIYKETMIMYTNYYSDDYVCCITQDGTEVFRYKHQQLGYPFGICSDEDNNIYVTGWNSNNIHQLTEDGQLNRVLLTQADGIKYPFSTRIKCIMGETYMAVTCENTIRVYTWD